MDSIEIANSYSKDSGFQVGNLSAMGRQVRRTPTARRGGLGARVLGGRGDWDIGRLGEMPSTN